MNIAVCHQAEDAYVGQIVAAALLRSFSSAQVQNLGDAFPTAPPSLAAWINPPDSYATRLARLLDEGSKVLVLGRIGPLVADVLGLDLDRHAEWPAKLGACRHDPSLPHDVSPLAVVYDDGHALARLSPLRVRPLCRFDFAEEWNNLGFGRITLDGGPWALQSVVRAGDATPLAHLQGGDTRGHVYAALCERTTGAALWINRPVGPVDSLEWPLVEAFFADYRADDLPCSPCLAEIPAGFAGAVCARLDCDEAIGSSRPLVELYQAYGLPLSLALLTGQTFTSDDLALAREVVARGASVVSHSVRHLPDWGGSYAAACDEARQSRDWIEANLPEAAPVRFAVSPFHQNPPAAVAALADSGYEGFVGGIIANDPEYLLGRAGRAPLAPRPIVSFSAQCMLHGDCYQRYGRSVGVYCESFENHLQAGTLFGYLDHPFSARYQYGWSDEATRLDAHRQLIEHIRQRDGIWWADLASALQFLSQRDKTSVAVTTGGRLSVDMPCGAGPPLAIRWKGRQFAYGIEAAA